MKKPLTIAFVFPFEYESSLKAFEYCGVISKELSTQPEIEVVSIMPNGFLSEMTRAFPRLQGIVASIERPTVSLLLLRMRLSKLATKARRQKRDFAVILGSQSLGILAHGLDGFRVIAVVSDLIDIHAAFGAFGKKSSFGSRFSARANLSGLYAVAGYIVPSKSVLENLAQAIPGTRERIVVATPPVLGDELIPIPPGELASRQNQLWRVQGVIPPSYILYGGSSSWNQNRRGLICLCGALKKMMPVSPSLVFAGDPPTREESALIESCGISFYHFGDLPAPDLNTLMSGAECYLNPALADGFSSGGLLALACGIPLVITDTPGLSETFLEAASLVLPAPAKENDGAWIEESACLLSEWLALPWEKRTAASRQGMAIAAGFTREKFRAGILKALVL